MISIDISSPPPQFWPVVGRGGPAPAPPYQRDGRHWAARLGRLGPLLLTGQTVSKSGRFSTFWNFKIKKIFQDYKEEEGLNIEQKFSFPLLLRDDQVWYTPWLSSYNNHPKKPNLAVSQRNWLLPHFETFFYNIISSNNASNNRLGKSFL